MTALHVAAKHGNLEACHYIMTMTEGSKLINSQDDGGWTPVVWASEHKHPTVVKYVSGAAGASQGWLQRLPEPSTVLPALPLLATQDV